MPRDAVSNAILRQMKKDDTDHVWLSFLTITDTDIRKRFPNIYEKCLEEGYDITKEWIPVVPAQHYFMGGVEVDLYGRTSMAHLYAAGETCCNGVHGANRLASNSLLESLVFARSAARHMTAYHEKNPDTASRYKKYADLPLETVAEVYGLDLNEYSDAEKYTENNKKQILDAIRKDEKETA